MRCPYCATDDTRVIDSRPAEGGRTIRRRRACAMCGRRFTTFERPEVMVAKRDGRREPFTPEKVRGGVERALADRPVPVEAVDRLVRRVEAFAVGAGGEITTEAIGHAVLEDLRELDEVGYLRFASVYKEFQGARDFEREVAALEDRT